MKYDQVILVRAKTRLEELIERFNTKAQAKFYLERGGENFQRIEDEHVRFYTSMEKVVALCGQAERYKILDRSFLPTYLFGAKDLIIGLGQDGLIANIAKYAKGQPILGFNPNPEQYDGVLLPYNDLSSKRFQGILAGDFDDQSVTMAKASLSDGQSLLAFNDLFIGPRSHTSARYQLWFGDQQENQSSSGVIVSTGIGSTGWMSSITNMVNGIGDIQTNISLSPSSQQLVFAVREPFKSKYSSATICSGIITDNKALTITSSMVNKGVIFSDGIEQDFLSFNMGTRVQIGIANTKATLVQ